MAENITKLIIVCGLPGSGKTTHAKLLEERLNAVRFCPDDWFEALSINLHDETRRAGIEALQWRLAQKLLARGVSVIVEWGTWGRVERDALRITAREIGVSVELHYLSEPLDTLYERLQRRARESPPITRAQLIEWAEIFQKPDPEEISLFDDYVCLSEPSC